VQSGHGALEVEGGRVIGLTARSPLQLLATGNHGRAAWVFTSSLGGGLVDGDALSLRIRVGHGGAAFLTTQSATRVYPGAARQEIEADVDGLLIHAPDPVMVYAGADFRQRAVCRLAADATLVWVDSLVAGRVERGERWAFARHESRLRLERAGRLVLADGLLLDRAHGPLGQRLGRFAALATLVAIGPEASELRAAWLAAGPRERRASVLAAPSAVGGDGALVRLAADSAGALRAVLGELLRPIERLLGDDPFARKW
jgi:urease accessory protein